MELVTAPPPTEDLTHEAVTWTDRARALRVVDEVSFLQAGEWLKGIKALRTRVAEAFDPIVTKAHAAHKEAVSQRRTADEPLVEAERVLKQSIGIYTAERERQAREEARQREAELRRREEDDRVAEAAALEQAGEVEEATALIEQPVVVAPVIPRPAVLKMRGISQREVWRAEVTNLQALVQAAAADEQWLALLKVDQVVLNGLARSLKGALKIPGVTVRKDTVVAASGRV